MDIDLDRLAKLLNTTASDIKSAADKVKSSPSEAMEFVPGIMQNMQNIQSFGKLEGVSVETDSPVYKAIGLFLKNTKDAQEKVGVMGAAIFNHPRVLEVTANLERVKKKLDAERGGRVTRKQQEGM